MNMNDVEITQVLYLFDLALSRGLEPPFRVDHFIADIDEYRMNEQRTSQDISRRVSRYHRKLHELLYTLSRNN